jgi:hypothetical protein
LCICCAHQSPVPHLPAFTRVRITIALAFFLLMSFRAAFPFATSFIDLLSVAALNRIVRSFRFTPSADANARLDDDALGVTFRGSRSCGMCHRITIASQHACSSCSFAVRFVKCMSYGSLTFGYPNRTAQETCRMRTALMAEHMTANYCSRWRRDFPATLTESTSRWTIGGECAAWGRCRECSM